MTQIVQELQDLTHLSWAKTRNSSGIAGSFLKACDEGPDGNLHKRLSLPILSSENRRLSGTS